MHCFISLLDTHNPISRFSQCSITKAVVCVNPVCGIIHIKEPCISEGVPHVAATDFLSCYPEYRFEYVFIELGWGTIGWGCMCVCVYMYVCRKEGNVLFNDALNTFYLRLYGVKYMVKDHSDSERGNLLPPHGLLFENQTLFYMHHPTDRIAHTTISP